MANSGALTGKNLGAIIGEFGDYLSHRNGITDNCGSLEEVLHVSANPKYGSEKKGAPTAYFLMVAPERIRVNCDTSTSCSAVIPKRSLI